MSISNVLVEEISVDSESGTDLRTIEAFGYPSEELATVGLTND